MFIQSMRNCQKGIYYLLCMNKGSQESCRPGNTLLHLLVVPILFCNLHSPGELLNVHLTQNTPDSTAGSTKSISSTNTCWSLRARLYEMSAFSICCLSLGYLSDSIWLVGKTHFFSTPDHCHYLLTKWRHLTIPTFCCFMPFGRAAQGGSQATPGSAGGKRMEV